jgi:hypothetical protein
MAGVKKKDGQLELSTGFCITSNNGEETLQLLGLVGESCIHHTTLAVRGVDQVFFFFFST